MIVDETFYRSSEIGRERRRMPAAVYNAAHLLVARAASGAVFVPIRSMQFLAVLDREEFIFVDRDRGRAIQLAWREFNPHARSALDEAVPYAVVYYSEEAPDCMQRLQGEFARALHETVRRNAAPQSARVSKLPKPL